MLQNSFDYIGLCYYTASYAKHTGKIGRDITDDGRYELLNTNKKGEALGNPSGAYWMNLYP